MSQTNNEIETLAVPENIEEPVVEKPKGIQKLSKKQRKAFMKIKPDPDTVLELLDQGLTLWQITEKIYDFNFDHNDRKTWLFYQKVNNIRTKNDKPINKARYVRICPHCNKEI